MSSIQTRLRWLAGIVVLVLFINGAMFLWNQLMPEKICASRGISSVNLATYGVEDLTTSHVLVLGSGGLVGSSLVKELRKRGFAVAEVKGRQHLDLREKGSLDIFNDVNIGFVYFLACEVGGAKFLKLPSAQEAIMKSNIDMYDNVFTWLEARNIRFIFSSSQLSNQPTNYGRVKKIGEEKVAMMENGKSLQFWNVYGDEDVGLKSHVLSDWVYSCLTKNSVKSLTDGYELRQYLHTEDCADGLIAMMEYFDELPEITPFTTGVWDDLRKAAELFKVVLPQCEISFSDGKSTVAKGQTPDLNNPLYNHWKPTLVLEEGIRKLVDSYSQKLSTEKIAQPYISIVVYDEAQGYNLNIVQDVEDWIAMFSRYKASIEENKGQLWEVLVVFPSKYENTNWPSWIQVVTLPPNTNYTFQTAIHAGLSEAHGEYVMLLDTRTCPSEMLMKM